jgi:hypothetical protein
MLEGRAVESLKDRDNFVGVSDNLDLGGAGANPVCVPARLEFCIVRSLLGGLLENMQSKQMKSEFNIPLRMGLEGTMVESRVFHCGKSNSKGGWTWLQLIRSCALYLPSVQF